ncbi:MAG: hypothetical protein WEA61_05800 [Anaerolineales bacterium]
MPTIDLARLKVETAQLSEVFSEADDYVRGIQHLLQRYSVPVHRQGRVKGMRPVLMSYEVPPPLLKHIQLEMKQSAEAAPDQALKVADGLWALRSLETRLLAARMLGAIQAWPDEITSRLEAWAQGNLELLLATELAQAAPLLLCRHYPEEILAFAARMLASGSVRRQSLALGVLHTLITTSSYSNLPPLFALLGTALALPDRKLRQELAHLLVALAERSPHETEYFLLHRLTEQPGEGIRWIARQLMKSLPDEPQARVRKALNS